MQTVPAFEGHRDMVLSLDASSPQHAASFSESMEYAELRRAWQAVLNSDREIEFEPLLHQFVEDAWRNNQRNQVRTAKQLNISRNILRTYLKKACLL